MKIISTLCIFLVLSVVTAAKVGNECMGSISMINFHNNATLQYKWELFNFLVFSFEYM